MLTLAHLVWDFMYHAETNPLHLLHFPCLAEPDEELSCFIPPLGSRLDAAEFLSLSSAFAFPLLKPPKPALV
ncbi:MAG: hypothetical protein D6736_18225 [Nitrospinota bacterium]|nr:MAG: hypothetical protein D6736_18225 [Nitrospinota bacterium]